MTVEVIIRNRGANYIMDIVVALRTKEGWVQGQDFDFAFRQSRWDEMIGEIPTTTRFIFYNEKYASIFALKYAS